ncbi:hypothetical protein TWF730_009683 [Orbilia blumenaviensis]|uniref:Uncharacterized protein n=1 Tax=Orbilia blumenaviensis TaxID=1796055 RepID=A0AAV9UWM9_9PEZI
MSEPESHEGADMADVADTSTNPGEETMLSRILKDELAGLLVLRDKLPQPDGACTICSEAEKGHTISFILDDDAKARFESFRKAGYLPDALARSDDFENLLWTCPDCHRRFDNPYPTLLVLPTNLDFFVLWEHRDYERRTQEAKAGPDAFVSARTVPEHDDYKGPYRFHVLTDDPTSIPDKLRKRLENEYTELYTEASPTALILHAGRAMGVPMTYEKKYGMSLAVRYKLIELFRLWERPPPKYEAPMTSSAAASFLDMQEHPSSSSPVRSKDGYKSKKNNNKKKGKRARSPSTRGSGSGSNSFQSMIKTPKSKRVRMKELTRSDDRERKKVEAEGRMYISPASPEGIGLPLRKGGKGLLSRPWSAIKAGFSEGACKDGKKDRPEDSELKKKKENRKEEHEEENTEEDGDEEYDDDEEGSGSEVEETDDGDGDYELEDSDGKENDQDEDSDKHDGGWSFGPRMSSSSIIERASKRKMPSKR